MEFIAIAMKPSGLCYGNVTKLTGGHPPGLVIDLIHNLRKGNHGHVTWSDMESRM